MPVAATLPDFAAEAQRRVDAGYYDVKRLPEFSPPKQPASLAARLRGGFGILAEIKPSSPTRGEMRANVDAGVLARVFAEAGAAGISALAVPERFGGSLENVCAASAAGKPVLFKDFVVDEAQLRCARRCGASAVLLILDLHERGLARGRVETFITRAHDLGLEVLLEVYDSAGYDEALATGADLIGVNNRDLRAEGLPISIATAERVLAACRKDRPVLALSGSETPKDVARMRDAGADGVLVGSALMSAAQPALKLKELIGVTH